jgi:hypothetical protein
MSTSFVSESGTIHRRVAERTSREVHEAGRFVQSVGTLCTACLAGSWARTMLHARQVVCEDCRWLVEHLVERDGLPAALTSPDEAARERAVGYRTRRLREIFDAAGAQGVTFADVVEPADDTRELARVVYDALVPQDDESRLRRLAGWAPVLGPGGGPLADAVRADAGRLASAYQDHRRAARVADARSRLESSLADAARSIRRVDADAAALVAIERES